MSPASSKISKRRRLSSPEGANAVVKKLCESAQHGYGDTYAAGNAFVHNGDNLHFHQGASSLQLEVQQMQASLAFPGMHDRYESLSEAQDGTYRWILDQDSKGDGDSEGDEDSGGDKQSDDADLEDDDDDDDDPGEDADFETDVELRKRRECMEDFFRWYETGAGIYWISGKPGSGKSTLMKFLVEHIGSCNTITQHRSLIILSFFLWVGGESLQRSKLGCLKSLLWQLLQDPIAQQVTVQKCRPYFKNAWSEQRLEAALLATFRHLDSPILLFIDGLDEGQDHGDLLDLLNTLNAADNIKMCVSSRPEPIFARRLRGLPSLKLHDLNSGDIQHVIKQKLLDNPMFIAWSSDSNLCRQESNVKSLALEIECKSEGVFLWVHLVIKDLLRGISNDDDFEMLSRRLKRLPGDIIELYQDMLRRSHDDASLYKDDISLYLSLVLHRKFNLLEFCFAIDGKLRNKYLQPSIFDSSTETMVDINCDMVSTWIQGRTAGLVDVIDSGSWHSIGQRRAYGWIQDTQSLRILDYTRYKVEVVHRTAYDFLLNTVAGKALLRPSADMDTEVVQICFQVKLICELILPGLQGVCVDAIQVIGVLDCRTCTDEDVYAGVYNQGEGVLHFLYDAGLIHPEKEFLFTTYFHIYGIPKRIAPPFPSSVHSKFDLASILLSMGRYRATRAWLTEHGSLNDTKYLSTLLALSMTQYLRSNNERVLEFWDFVGFLMHQNADILQASINDGDESLFLPGEILYSTGSHDSHDHGCLERFWRESNSRNAYCTVRYLSVCHLCHDVWFGFPNRISPTARLWGNFCILPPCQIDLAGKHLKARDERISWLRDDRIMVVAIDYGLQDGKPMLSAVSESDSYLLINTIQGSSALNYRVYNMVELLEFEQLDSDVQCVLDEICERSPIVSFADAMRHMGKSEKTIHTFFDKEAKRMALEPAETQKGWKEWYWGIDAPPPLPASGEVTELIEP